MEREWKSIIGYEQYYLVSNLGEVFSVRKNMPMNPYVNNNGYKAIKLSLKGESKHYLIHRLVAMHFCEGYAKDLVVNHKDGCRTNNISSNLEWCTTKENIHDMKKRGTMNYTNAQNVAKIKNQKPIIVTTPGGEVYNFPSIKSACDLFNLQTGKMSMVANGLRKHHKGYLVKFKLDDDIV